MSSSSASVLSSASSASDASDDRVVRHRVRAQALVLVEDASRTLALDPGTSEAWRGLSASGLSLAYLGHSREALALLERIDRDWALVCEPCALDACELAALLCDSSRVRSLVGRLSLGLLPFGVARALPEQLLRLGATRTLDEASVLQGLHPLLHAIEQGRSSATDAGVVWADRVQAALSRTLARTLALLPAARPVLESLSGQILPEPVEASVRLPAPSGPWSTPRALVDVAWRLRLRARAAHS